MSSIKRRLIFRYNLAHQYSRYKQLVGNLEKTGIKVKFLSYLGIVFGILLLSWATSFLLLFLPAWNSNIDTINKLINVSPYSILCVIFRIIVVALFFILYWKAAVPFWNERPIERDRSLFARSGWGMAAYSLGAIILVICILMTCANIMKANTVFGPEDALRTDYPEDFGIIKRSWDVICQFADPGNVHSSTNFQGNVIALISAFAGILCLSGLAVSALVSMIARRTQQWKAGLIPYEYGFNNYVVIIGSNEQTATIIKSSLRTPGVEYVLVQTRKDVEKERAKIELRLELDEEKRVVFYYGDRALNEDVITLHLEKAKEVYILGEDMHYENEEDHDAYNISCLEHIAKYMCENERITEKNKKLRCHVSFEYQSTFMAFKFTHIYRSLNATIEFLPFNVHEIWAKKILVDNFAVISSGKTSGEKVIKYAPVETFRKKDPETRETKLISVGVSPENVCPEKMVHLVIVGMNQMGVALAMQAALLVHLPNFQRNSKVRTTITFIDNNAVQEGEFLRGRYSALFSLCRHRTLVCGKDSFDKRNYTSEEDNYDVRWHNSESGWHEWKDPMKDGRYAFMGTNFMDLQWEFIEGNVASLDIQNYLSVIAGDLEHRTCTIAVCFNNPQQSIATALYLPEQVLRSSLQILVYQQNSADMINMVATSEKEWKRYEKLKPFGMIEGCYTGDIFDNITARYANMVYVGESLIDEKSNYDAVIYRARRLWEELGIDLKLANIDLVDSFGLKLRAEGCDAESNRIHNNRDIILLAKAEHLRWLTERITMGYRPLTNLEVQDYKESKEQGKFVNSKPYFKAKRRAHLNICPNDLIKEWDPETYDKNTDKAIIEKIYELQSLTWRTILKSILPLPPNPKSPTSIVHDMVMVKNTAGTKTVQPFWVQRKPVTIGQWEMVMGSRPANLTDKPADSPITFVSWEEVQDFLCVLRKETGLPFDLPSQDEWIAAYEDSKTQQNPNVRIENMDGDVWQWTKTRHKKYKHNYVFCGISEKFKNHWKVEKAEQNCSYWLPSFKSEDLGFRLILPFDFDVELCKSVSTYDWKKDEEKVIDDLKKSLIEITESPEAAENIEHGAKSFLIAPTPVTQRQWKAVMHECLPDDILNPSEHRGDYLPVENVSFNDAQKFCEQLNKKQKEYNKEQEENNPEKAENNEKQEEYLFRLPTKEEWLRAAESGKADGKTIWCRDITKTTHEVHRKLDGAVYDMFGNVWEWCNSHDNDKGDIVREIMGGSWRFFEKECYNETEKNPNDRYGNSYWLVDYKADDVGFRVVAERKNPPSKQEDDDGISDSIV